MYWNNSEEGTRQFFASWRRQRDNVLERDKKKYINVKASVSKLSSQNEYSRTAISTAFLGWKHKVNVVAAAVACVPRSEQCIDGPTWRQLWALRERTIGRLPPSQQCTATAKNLDLQYTLYSYFSTVLYMYTV